MSEDEAARLVGSLIKSVDLVHNDMNEVEGATLHGDGVLLRASQFGGELFVEVSGPSRARP